MKRVAILLTAVLTLFLAACMPDPPQYTFEGTSTADGIEHPLSVTLDRYGDNLVGDYRVNAVPGKFRGTIDGEAVTANLTPSSACTFEFVGALTETELTGTFQPADCPGGKAGTWVTQRQ